MRRGRKDMSQTINYSLHHRLQREEWAENGTKVASKNTNNMPVEHTDAPKNCEPIVYVMLGVGCVNPALWII